MEAFGRLAILQGTGVNEMAKELLSRSIKNEQNDANEYLMQLLNCEIAQKQHLDNYLVFKYSGITKCLNKSHITTKHDLALSMEVPI